MIMASTLINVDAPSLHVHNSFKTGDPASNIGPLSPAGCRLAREAIAQWPDYKYTPLLSMHGLATRLGVDRVYCKDESPRFGLGSFKALGGAYAVSVLLMKHLQEKLGNPVTLADLTNNHYKEHIQDITVSCATDGNHGRSVAWGAQQFGCRCIIYIHSDVSEGRKSAIEQYGAQVIRIDGNYDDSVRIADEDAKTNNRIVVSDTSYPGYTSIPADVMRGYTVLADEALDQMGSELPTHVFLQGGVGGFAAAITRRVRDRCIGAQPRITVVEPDQAACIYESIKSGEPVAVHGDLATVMAGLACGEVSLIAFDTLVKEINDVLVISDETAIETMQLLAKGAAGDAPFVSGESGVTGLAGFILAKARPELSTKLALDANSRILVISTEGATDPLVYETLVGMSAQDVG